MGLFGFLSRNTEEMLHQRLSEILAEYHKLKALLEQQKALSEHITHIHRRIDSINSGIRHANSLQDQAQRLSLLHHLVQTEKQMLGAQRMLARQLELSAGKAISLERRTERSARQIRKAA